MFKSFCNGLLLFRSSSWLSAILRFRVIVILSFYNSMLLLYLSDIKICYMKSVVLLHPFLYFFVCSLCLCTCSIYLIQLNLYLNMIVRFLLGQKNNSLHIRGPWELVHGNSFVHAVAIL